MSALELGCPYWKTTDTHLGARISSYLAAMNMAVTPTNWSLINETTRADKNLSTMLTAIQSVSGNMWYRKCTWSNQSIRVVRIPLSTTKVDEDEYWGG